MKVTTKFMAALATLLAVFAIAVIAVLAHHQANLTHKAIAYGLTGLSLLAGTATIIQTYPLAATFPTAAQAFYNNTQISRVVMADGDTTAVLTHNWMLSAAQLAAFLPLIQYYIQALDSAGVTYPILSFALTDSNTVTITKAAVTGSGGTYVVSMQRPLSSTL